MFGEYTGAVMRDGFTKFVRAYHPKLVETAALPASGDNRLRSALALLDGQVHGRPPSFCTGCPERPIFTALKMVERDLGQHHVASDIGCHLFSILPPFNIGSATMGYGLGGAAAAAFNGQGKLKPEKRVISVMGDGGFWHNGLVSSGRQRRLQQVRQRLHRRRQRLYLGDRWPGHPVVQTQQRHPLDGQLD